MTETQALRIASISDNPDLDWVWIRDLMDEDLRIAGRKLEWRSFSTAPSQSAVSPIAKNIAAHFQSLARYNGARKLADAAKNKPFDVIVSHGPLTTAWTEAVIGSAKQNGRHLGFSFNFTDLPAGPRRRLMKRAFKTVDAFAVFTEGEKSLYADWLDIDPERLIRAPWGVAPPLSEAPPREVDAPYVAALGGEARDYRTLCEAARLCPEIRFVAVARPHNFDGLNAPDNLKTLFNLPFNRAWGIVWHAGAALLPLRSQETPCGLVTLVGAMHLGKAQIATAAMGVADYLQEGETGLTVPANDAGALAAAIRRLQADPPLAARLGANAKTFAAAHCSEPATVAFFEDLLRSWFPE
ncbi:MAG: glycosyltransferase [Pseudomonadota bacterium]